MGLRFSTQQSNKKGVFQVGEEVYLEFYQQLKTKVKVSALDGSLHIHLVSKLNCGLHKILNL